MILGFLGVKSRGAKELFLFSLGWASVTRAMLREESLFVAPAYF